MSGNVLPPAIDPNVVSGAQVNMATTWPTFVVGKPGLDYTGVLIQSEPTLLTWKFGTMTREEMIGTAARLAKHIAGLEKWLEAVKEILKAQAILMVPLAGDTKEILGSNSMAATVSHRERTGLNLELLKADYDEAWIAKYSKTTEYYEIRWKEIK